MGTFLFFESSAFCPAAAEAASGGSGVQAPRSLWSRRPSALTRWRRSVIVEAATEDGNGESDEVIP